MALALPLAEGGEGVDGLAGADQSFLLLGPAGMGDIGFDIGMKAVFIRR